MARLNISVIVLLNQKNVSLNWELNCWKKTEEDKDLCIGSSGHKWIYP